MRLESHGRDGKGIGTYRICQSKLPKYLISIYTCICMDVMIYSIGSFEMLGDPGFGCWFRSWLDSQMPVQMHQTISLQRRVNRTKKGGGTAIATCSN